MKGIVAEINGSKAIILAQDGTFKKIRASEHMSLGCEVDLSQPASNTKIIKLVTRATSIAAAALFAIGVGYGAYCYTLPYSYVDVDINPSVELTANIYDRIIKVEALNEDAGKLLADHKLNNARLDEGVSKLLGMAVEQGYLNADNVVNNADGNTTPGAVKPGGDNKAEEQADPVANTAAENAVLLTVSSNNAVKSVELKKKIVKKVSEELDKRNINPNILAGEASVQQHDDARVLGVTPGKLALIEDAMEDQPDLRLDELKKSPVRDLVKKAIIKKAAENKAGAKAAGDKGGPKTAEGKVNQNTAGKNSKANEQKSNLPEKVVMAEQEQGTQTEQTQTAQTEQNWNGVKALEPKRGTLIPSEERAKKAEEIKKAPDEKRAREIRKAQEDKRAQDIKKAQEEKRAQELKKAQEEKRAQELKKAQEEKRVQELKKAEEAKKNQELKRIEELKKAQDEKKAKAAVAPEEKKKQGQKLKDELLKQIRAKERERENKKEPDNSGNKNNTDNRNNRPDRQSGN